MITEPRWKSYLVTTTNPIFTPKQCQMIIDAGRSQPKIKAKVGEDKGVKGGVLNTKTRTSHISWIPFKKMGNMYKDIEKIMKTTNIRSCEWSVCKNKLSTTNEPQRFLCFSI